MNKINDNVVFNYYDTAKGWDNTNPGWHTIIIRNVGSFKHAEIVTWLYDNIDGTERHCRWIRLNNGSPESGFKFRHERDYILFTLRWG